MREVQVQILYALTPTNVMDDVTRVHSAAEQEGRRQLGYDRTADYSKLRINTVPRDTVRVGKSKLADDSKSLYGQVKSSTRYSKYPGLGGFLRDRGLPWSRDFSPPLLSNCFAHQSVV